jgi:hypothetical protein
MDPEKIKAALEAIKNGDADAALALLEEMIAAAAGATEAPAEETPAEPLAEAPEAPAEEEEEGVAAAALMRLTGAPSVGAAIVEAGRLRARLDAAESESRATERTVRRDLVSELVKLGVEFPSTAWAGDSKDRKPVKRLADEPIDELRARVELHRKAPRASAVTPPASDARGAPADGGQSVSTPHGVVTLSKSELANCKQYGADVNEYAANKALHLAARSGGEQA